MSQSLLDNAGRIVSQNLWFFAPLVAFTTSFVLYGVLGKRVLGADDDYWEAIRTRLIPALDRVASKYGLYTEANSYPREKVGVAKMGEEEFEKLLVSKGYRRNPLSSVKTNPSGWYEDGSWAKRRNSLLSLSESMRASVPPFLGGVVRRFLSSLSEVLATRQTHITFYTESREKGDRIHVYAHDEPNSLNPFTALAHYYPSDGDKSAAEGIRRVKADLDWQ